jgi:hypothetical protein
MSEMNEIPAAVDDSVREFLRTRSKALFGNRDRLEVAAAIASASSGAVNAAELAYALELPNNRIRAQLRGLAEAGLLDVMPRDGSGRVWFIRVDHMFWSACIELRAQWEREHERSQRFG